MGLRPVWVLVAAVAAELVRLLRILSTSALVGLAPPLVVVSGQVSEFRVVVVTADPNAVVGEVTDRGPSARVLSGPMPRQICLK